MATPIGINWKAVWQDGVWGPVWRTTLAPRGFFLGSVSLFPILAATVRLAPTPDGSVRLRPGTE